MEALISTPKLYDLLSEKIGKQTAEALLVFIKGGIKDEMEYQIKALATNESLFKVNSMLKEDISVVRNELKEDINAVRSELKEDIGAVRNELKEEISAVRSELKEDISGLLVNIEKGFRQQFWLILVLFLPFYFTVTMFLFRLL